MLHFANKRLVYTRLLFIIAIIFLGYSIIMSIILNQPIQFPEVITFRITSRCLNNCDYCYGPKGISELSFEQLIPIFNLLKKGGAKSIVLTGGEPLLHTDFEKIVLYLSSLRFRIILDTSGDNFFRYNYLINSLASDLGLPLDETNAQESYRRIANFKTRLKILEYYKNLRTIKPSIKIGTVVTQQNIFNLDKLAKFISNYPVKRWKLYQFIPIGHNASFNKDFLSVSDEEFLKSAYRLKNKLFRNFEVVISPRLERSRAYFLINPNGSVILPEDQNNSCRERIIGHILDPDIIKTWFRYTSGSNYITNAGSTFGINKNFLGLKPLHNKLLSEARKYYHNTNYYVLPHIYWLLAQSHEIKKINIDPDIYYPLTILHDIGYSKMHRNPFFADSRLDHMKAGKTIATKILIKAKYPIEKSKRIASLISIHDTWAFGEKKIFQNCRELGIFDDLHFTSSLDDSIYQSISNFWSGNSMETLKRYDPDQDLDHDFKSSTTKKIHFYFLNKLKYNLISEKL